MLVETEWEHDGGSGGSGDAAAARGASFIGLYVLLAASVMVFVALTGAFVFPARPLGRLGQHAQTTHSLPSEHGRPAAFQLSRSKVARRAAEKAGIRSKFRRLVERGAVLCSVPARQALAWQQFERAAAFMSPQSQHSFFYVLTASHAPPGGRGGGAHLCGGPAATPDPGAGRTP